MHERRAFTLIELLVTLAIVALLAAITAVALRPIRATANRTRSANALRQMVLGFSAYSTDNNGALMPGYVSADRLNLLGLNPKLYSGLSVDPRLEHGGGGATMESDASSYMWRLSPYLDHAWKTLFIDYASGDIVDVVDREISRGVYGLDTADPPDLGAASIPSFGMNTTFVGGDDVHGGGGLTDRNPWQPMLDTGEKVLAATRLSEARNPSRLIVFAPSSYPPAEQEARFPEWTRGREILGAPSVRPPFIDLDDSADDPAEWEWINPQWRIETVGTPVTPKGAVTNDGLTSVYDEGESGWPVVRWGKQIPVGRLDGSVSSFEIERLYFDMRMWSPTTTGNHKVQ